MRENQGGFDTITGVLSKPETPLRSPMVYSSRQGAERDCWESWRRECLCSEKEFRALFVQISQMKAEIYGRVKSRETVKAQRNVR